MMEIGQKLQFQPTGRQQQATANLLKSDGDDPVAHSGGPGAGLRGADRPWAHGAIGLIGWAHGARETGPIR